MKSTVARSVAAIGLLSAFAIALSFFEALLPPLPFLPPGAKAGFSNIAVMITAASYGGGATLCVALLKSLFVFITRGPTAFMMSAAGGLLSAFVLWLLLKHRCSLLLSGITGAVTHNTAQLAVAVVFTGTPGLIAYFPALLLFALVAGSITGLLFQAVYPPFMKIADRFIQKERE